MTIWALKRQLFILFILFLIIVIIAVIIFYSVRDTSPTCTDGIQNQDELSTDCGGVCGVACVFEQTGVSVLWGRSFRLDDSKYSATAYLRGLNGGLIARDVPYEFELFDSNNSLVNHTTGFIDILPFGITPVFVPEILVGNKNVATTHFSLLESPSWLASPDVPNFIISNEKLILDDIPTVTATITNQNPITHRNISVFATVFDANENAIATSRTIVKSINPNETREILFTWRQPFSLLNSGECKEPINLILALPQGYKQTIEYATHITSNLTHNDNLTPIGVEIAVKNLNTLPINANITNIDNTTPIEEQIKTAIDLQNKKPHILIITDETLQSDTLEEIVNSAKQVQSQVFLAFLTTPDIQIKQDLASLLPADNTTYSFNSRLGEQFYSLFQQTSCPIEASRVEIIPIPDLK